MGGFECFLLTLLVGNETDLATIPVALKVDADKLPAGVMDDPMAPESKMEFSKLLPDHIRVMGPIINVESIYEVCVNESVIQRIN